MREVSTTQPQAALPGTRLRVLIVIGVLLGPALVLLLQLQPQLDIALHSAISHFWVVSIAALIAMGLALLMLNAAVARSDGRVFLIGVAFTALSTIFLIHAISTPGVLFSNTSAATAVSTPVALFTCALVLLLSSSSSFAAQGWLLSRWRLTLIAGFLLWLAYTLVVLWYFPGAVQPASSGAGYESSYGGYGESEDHSYGDGGGYGESEDHSYGDGDEGGTAGIGNDRLWLTTLIGLATRSVPFLYGISMMLFLLAAAGYRRRWLETPTRPVAALALAALLLAETALAAGLGEIWHLTFWLYHVLLLSAVSIAAYGVLTRAEEAGMVSGAVDGLLLASTLERQREGFRTALSTLVEALDQRDTSSMTALNEDLRMRFGLAEDQIDLLNQSVQLFAKEREEQRRLRALVEVSRAATTELEPDVLLRNALLTFARLMDCPMCAIGLISGTTIVFKGQHRIRHGIQEGEDLLLPAELLPGSWMDGDDAPLVGEATIPMSQVFDGDGAGIILPLTYHDHVLGVMAIQMAAETIDARTVAVCSSVSSQLATALSNARLYQQIHEKHANLLRLEQDKEQMTHMIVHDLKNPLTAMMSYMDLLKMTGLRAEQIEIVDGAKRSSSNMYQLVSTILDVARLEEGRMEVHPEPTEIHEMLDACIKELEPWADQEGQHMQLECPEGEHLLIDPALMKRVITNLISNAIKHTPRNTRIVVGADIEQEHVLLWVRDNGPGIPPERLQTLFERFSVGDSNGHRQSNTGLGLTFCKLATEAHNGTVHVESELGRGTVFTVALPAAVLVV